MNYLILIITDTFILQVVDDIPPDNGHGIYSKLYQHLRALLCNVVHLNMTYIS